MDKPSRRQFIKASTIAGLGAAVSHGKARAFARTRALTLYVGTYTAPGKSEGIYIYRMDPDTGELKRFNSVKAVNPSYLALDPRKRHLYAVNEVGDFGGQSSGALSSFAIDPP